MEIKKLSGQNFVSSNTKNLESINSSSVSKNIDLIKAQTRNKLSTYINIKNAVRILEKYANENGYIKLYTEVESNFVIDDIVYITYTEPTITGDTFSLENPAIPFEPYYLGYKIIKLNNYRNEIVIDRDYNDIGDGKKLSNQYISKISARGGDYFDDVSDGVVFYDCNVFDINFGTIQGIVSGSTISGATISVLNSSYRDKNVGIMNGTISDKNGNYSINLPLGKNDLICRHPLYLTTGLTLDVDSGIKTGVTIFMISGTTTLPTVTTSGITNITNITATCGGNVTNDGGEIVTKRGVCWIISGSTLPTILNDHTSDTGITFTSNLTFLNRGTSYVVRAYATNYNGTAYGSAVTFTTLGELPIVDTNDVSGIYSSGATGGGNVISDGGTGVTSRGVCWLSGTTLVSPTTGDTRTINGSGLGLFTSTLSGLTRMTDYYVRAYAINKVGVAYGDEVFFRTIADLPVVETSGITGRTYSGATIGGIVKQDYDPFIEGYSGGDQVTERGICWFTGPNPTINNYRTSETLQSIIDLTGYFTHNLTELLANVNYYARAYAINSAGVAYGGTGLTFKTLITYPIVLSVEIINITKSGATFIGNVTYNGGYLNVVRGVCWSSDPNPNPTSMCHDESRSGGNGIGVYNVNLTRIYPNTTYYARAYAFNPPNPEYPSIVLRSYGDILSFITPTVAVLTTTVVSNPTSTGLTSGGDITFDGRSPITMRGVCWDDPEFNDYCFDVTNYDVWIGTYQYIVGDTVQYLGFDYICILDIDADYIYPSDYPNCWQRIDPPTTYMSIGSKIYEDSSVTNKFDLWNSSHSSILKSNINHTNPSLPSWVGSGNPLVYTSQSKNANMYPTISNYTTNDGAGIGQFTSYMTGLVSNSIYYVRAYAINSVDVEYGNIQSGKTLALLPTVETSQPSNIGITYATVGGNVISDGGANLNYVGVCWGLNQDVNLSNCGSNHTESGLVVTGPFNCHITNLIANTIYYVKAYATNIIGESYGEPILLITLAGGLPEVSTKYPSINITQTGMTSGGNVFGSGSTTIVQRGVCWTETGIPVIGATNTTQEGPGGLGWFTSEIIGLNPGVKYYIRAYAINGAGISYGGTISTTTLSWQPSVITTSISTITYNSAIGNGFIVNGLPVSEFGICWSISHNPTISDYHNIGTYYSYPNFYSNMTGLINGQLYYVRAYGTNANGTGYGNELSFTTLLSSKPTVTTDSAFVDYSDCECEGNIVSLNGSNITQHGICIDTFSNPDSGTTYKTINLGPTSNTGLFTCAFNTLSPATWHYRAFARNASGINYGSDKTFTIT